MRTVLLHCLYPINVRNMLRCGVVEDLLEDRDIRIVVVSPLASDPAFRDEFARDRVAIEAVPAYAHPPLPRRLEELAIERFVHLHPTRALELRWERGENVATGRFKGGASRLKSASGRIPVPVPLLLRAIDRLIPAAAYAPVLDRYRPDVVAIASAWQTAELPWTTGARRHGIPSLAIDMNWDSFESKRGIVRGPDELLVWAHALKEKAVARFGYPPDRVHVVGAAQFDLYFSRAGVPDREAFIRGLGFPGDARVITLAAVLNSPHDPDRLRLLHRWITAGAFGPNAHLLVRLHPADTMDRWHAYAGLERVRIQSGFIAGGSRLRGETREEMAHKVATLLHSDVLVNVNSTIAFEAMLTDLPTVMVAFDGEGGHLPFRQSDARFLDYEHIRDLVGAGGLRVARTPEELRDAIATYLADRAADRDARARAAAALYGWNDAGSAGRIAARIRARLPLS